jgi:hypothetical protein
MTEVTPFKYTDAEWAAVRDSVPSDLMPDKSRGLFENKATQFLEAEMRRGQVTKEVIEANRKAVLAHRKGVLERLELARKFDEIFSKKPNYLYEWENQQKLEGVVTFVREQMVPSLERARKHWCPSRGKKRDLDRDDFIYWLITVWDCFDLRVRTSNDPLEGHPCGPLIRFIMAALRPVYGREGLPVPSTHALRRKVNYYRDNYVGEEFGIPGVKRKYRRRRRELSSA